MSAILSMVKDLVIVLEICSVDLIMASGDNMLHA